MSNRFNLIQQVKDFSSLLELQKKQDDRPLSVQIQDPEVRATMARSGIDLQKIGGELRKPTVQETVTSVLDSTLGKVFTSFESPSKKLLRNYDDLIGSGLDAKTAESTVREFGLDDPYTTYALRKTLAGEKASIPQPTKETMDILSKNAKMNFVMSALDFVGGGTEGKGIKYSKETLEEASKVISKIGKEKWERLIDRVGTDIAFEVSTQGDEELIDKVIKKGYTAFDERLAANGTLKEGEGILGKVGLRKVGMTAEESISPSQAKAIRESGLKASQEEVLLRQSLRKEANIAEDVASITRKEERDRLTDLFRKKNVDVKLAQRSVRQYIKNALPTSEQGKLMSLVDNTTSTRDVINAFTRINERVEKIAVNDEITALKKDITKALETSRIDVGFKSKIKSVIDDFELSVHKGSTMEKLQDTKQYIEQERSHGNNVYMPEKILDGLEMLGKKQKKDITIDEVRDMRDRVAFYTRLGGTKLKSKEALYLAERNYRTVELFGGNTIDGESIKGTVQDAAQRFSSERAMKRTFKLGKDVSEAEKSFYVRSMQKKSNIQNFLMKAHIGLTPIDGLAERTGMVPMKRVIDTHYDNYLPWNDERFVALDEIISRNKLNDNNFERVGIHAIANQEGGVPRLLANNKNVTLESIEAIKLTKEEQELYDFVISENKKVYPQVRDWAYQEYNIQLKDNANYVSFHTDNSQLNDAELYARFNGDGIDKFLRTKHTESGFIRERDIIASNPLELNVVKVFERHMDDVAYALNMSRPVRMYSEILNTKEAEKQLGDVGTLAWRQYMDLLARKGGTLNKGRIKALDVLRKNIQVGVMTYKISSALVQLSSFADTCGTLGVDWATKGAWNISNSSEWRTFIMENFPEVKKAVGDDIAFRELGDTHFEKLAKAGYKPLQILDGLMRSTAAAGAYEKLCKEAGIAVDLVNPNQELIQQATKLMRDSQGSSFFKDTPLALTTGFGVTDNAALNKTLFTFQSFMLSRFENEQRQIWREGFKKGNYGKGITSLMWFTIFAAGTEEGIRRTVKSVTGQQQSEDETFTEGMVLNNIQSVPVLGSLVSSLSYGTNPIPAVNLIQNALNGWQGYNKGVKPSTKLKGLVGLGGATGTLLGVPGSTQFAQLIKSSIDTEGKGSGSKGEAGSSSKEEPFEIVKPKGPGSSTGNKKKKGFTLDDL